MSSQELPDTELETLREALKLVKSGEFDKAIPLLELVADTAPVPALLNNIGGAYMAIGRVEEARSYFEKALIDNSGQGTAARSNLDQIIGPTQLSEFAGVEAEVTRFEDTGGMITLEVTFRNVSANNVKFWVSPSEAYLLAEQTATKWSSVQSSDSIPENYLALTLNPGDIHLIWMKFRVGDAEPAQFTAVVPAVPRPFNRLVLD